MTLVPKNGYSYTGYTEPFIASEAISATDPLIKVGGYLNNDDTPVAIGIDGAVPIENTEWRNAGLFVRVIEIVDGTTLKTKDINFDAHYRMDTGHGVFIIRDDVDAYQKVNSVVYDNANGEYTVTVDDTTNMTAYKSYKVAARVPDLNSGAVVLATKDYAAGDLVIEGYTP